MARVGRSGILAMAGCLAAAMPATAAEPFDGLYTGSIACEASGASPGFSQAVAFVVRGGAFVSEKGVAGQRNYERMAVSVAADGTLIIEGRYIAEVEKPILFRGRVEDGRMRAEGPRGPRRCVLDAALPPASGATAPYRVVPDVAARRAVVGKPGDAAFACPEPPAPARDVRVEPFYQKGDPTHSIVDPEAYEARRKAAAPFDQLAGGIARLGDRYLRTNRAIRNSPLPVRLDRKLGQGRRHAGEATPQGAYERKWTLTTLSLNYALLPMPRKSGRSAAAW